MTREKPILFSPPMVKALLNTKPGAWPAEGIDPAKPCKWQTRRCIKNIFAESPIKTGDILWVREKWSCTGVGSAGNMNTAFIAYAADGGSKIIDVSPERALYFSGKGLRRSPLFMPRDAARITLEVKSVRIEQLRDITGHDARAEGLSDSGYILPGEENVKPYKQFELPLMYRFRVLWDSLNAKRGYGWKSNPWVWVYEFMRLT